MWLFWRLRWLFTRTDCSRALTHRHWEVGMGRQRRGMKEGVVRGRKGRVGIRRLRLGTRLLGLITRVWHVGEEEEEDRTGKRTDKTGPGV